MSWDIKAREKISLHGLQHVHVHMHKATCYAWQCGPGKNILSMLCLVKGTIKKESATPCTWLKIAILPQAHLFQVILFTSVNEKMLSFLTMR